MADLSSLSADQLAKKVRPFLAHHLYDAARKADAALAELQTRANQHDNALNGWRERDAAALGARKRAEVLEKERDQWQELATRLAEEAGVDAEQMLAQARAEAKP